MSDAVSYISEPNTVGKVVVVTTLGEFDVELFSRECPLACRNFVQLCLENYYNGCIFHRIIKNFMAQTGDPTGTGFGGESTYDGGAPFKDEFHGRLKFNRRGLVGMASSGKDANTSQWFITLGKADWLDKKHTMFGKITGDTIYNAIKLNDVDVGEEDRPTAPPKIIRTEVISNPFPDIVPRIKVARQTEDNKSKVKGTKNLSLLSFADDEQMEEDDSNLAIVAKSVHDIDDSGQFSKKTVEQQLAEAREEEENRREQDVAAKREATRDALRAKPKDVPQERKRSRSSDRESSDSDRESWRSRDADTRKQPSEVSTDNMDEAQFDAYMKQKLIAAKGGSSSTAASTSASASITQPSTTTSQPKTTPSASDEYLSLVKSLKSKHTAAGSDKRSHALKVEEATRVDASEESLYTSSAANRLKYIARKRNKQLKRREDDTLAKLAAFTNTVRHASSTAAEKQSKTEDSSASAVDSDAEANSDGDKGWLSHTIKFAKRPQDFIGSALRDADAAGAADITSDYAIIDPKGTESSITSMAEFEKLKTAQWKQAHMKHQQAMEKKRSQSGRNSQVEDISDQLMQLTEQPTSSIIQRNRSSRSRSKSTSPRNRGERSRSRNRSRIQEVSPSLISITPSPSSLTGMLSDSESRSPASPATIRSTPCAMV